MPEPSFRKSTLKENESLIGRRFGSLVVVSISRVVDPVSRYLCECKCDCGNMVTPLKGNLLKGCTRSCGCMRRKNAIDSRCACCKKVKSHSEFWKDSNSVSGRSSRCIECRQKDSHGSQIKGRYGITAEKYKDMLEKQGGRCAICGTSDPSESKRRSVFSVDHCHVTGRVRGLLCAKCNSGIGMLGDRAENAMRAYLYLTRNQEAA